MASSRPVRTRSTLLLGALLGAFLAPGLMFGASQLTSPSNGQVISVTNITFAWTQDNAATGYDVAITQAPSNTTVFSGQLAGSNSTSTVINLPTGDFAVTLRVCSDADLKTCAQPVSRNFTVRPDPPPAAPQIIAPSNNQQLAISTLTFSWTAVPSVQRYQLTLRNNTRSTTDLFILVESPGTSTTFSVRSGQYTLEVRSCNVTCGAPATVNFQVQLPPIPAAAPAISACTVTNNNRQNSLQCNWSPVTNADLYVLRVVQPAPAGPGGGALTVASNQLSTTTATTLVPNGNAFVFVQACNGDGCGPQSAPFGISPNFGNPATPIVGDPVGGLAVDGPTVTLSWSRIPGDADGNTSYRLYVQDLARSQPALDIVTTQNYWGAQFAAGRRYDAQVIALPASSNPIPGTSQGFTTRGASPQSPTLVQPQHQGTAVQGNTKLSWSPIPGGGLYQYWISRQDGKLAANGVTTGLEVQVPIQSLNNTATNHVGIVRVCNNGLNCNAASATGWGPWSNTPGNSGVTNFNVTPMALPKVDPVISQLQPNSGARGTTIPNVTITGLNTHFDSRSTILDFGLGITPENLRVASPTSLAVDLRIDAATATGQRNVTITTGREIVTLTNGFAVSSSDGPSPLITDFNPKTAPAGSLITISGANLAPNPRVTLAKLGGGVIEAPVMSAAAATMAFTIPPGAATGPISLIVGGRPAASASPLTIVPSKDLDITVGPSTADLIRGQSVAYSVRLTSTNGFSQLAALSLTGLPSGVTAAFRPSQITAGQTSILTLSAPAGQAVSSSDLSISAAADVEGLPVSKSATARLNVVAPSTSFIGRTVVDDALQTPLAGVTVTMLGRDGNGGTTGCSGSTTSDAAGNFALRNLSASCVGRQLVGFDGLTATSPPGDYAGVNLVYTLSSGQVTVSPVLVHLPRIDDKETFLVQQNSSTDQSYSFGSVPGLSLTVYRNTTFTMPDGSRPNPFPLVAVQVPVDRLPDAKPPVPTMLSVFIVAFQPANARASQPVAVYYPNTISTAPGSSMPLMTLDPTRGQMVPYGTAVVSADGSQIVPDLDPAFPGRRYGIVNFDWHGPMPAPPPANQFNPGPPGGGGGFGGGGPAGGPGPGPAGGSGPGGGSGSGPGGGGPGGGPGGGSGGGPGGGPGGGGSSSGSSPSCPTAMLDPSLMDHLAPSTAQAGDPVDLSSGIMTLRATDLAIRGGRGSISWGRVFRSMTTIAGPMGVGWYSNYSFGLDTANTATAAAIFLIMPDGNRFLFSRGTDGLLRNSTIPALRGALLSTTQQEPQLRWKDGTVFRFRSFGFGGLPWLVSIADPNLNTVTITRDPNDPVRITQVTDPVGRSLAITYDGNGRATQVIDPVGRSVRYAYNQFGLTSVTDPEGGVTRYEYVAAGQLSRVIDANGVIQAVNTFDAVGRVIAQDRPDGGRLTFTYTPVNPEARTSPVQTTRVSDRLGVEHTYRFTPTGFVIGIVTKDGHSLQHSRGSTNEIVRSENAGAQKSYSYDGNGNLIALTDELGRTTAYEYEPLLNRITAIRNALGETTRFAYDPQGNLLSLTDARGSRVSYTYNEFGQVVEITDAMGAKTIMTYDSVGNLVKTTDALGNSTDFVYDATSRLTETRDPLGRRTKTAYDRLDRVVSATDARGGVTYFSYDPVGSLLSLTDARANTTKFVYDSMNRMVTRTTPLGTSDSRTYDQNGNLIRFADRRGHAGDFTYDGENRLVSESYTDGAVVRRTYDNRGRPVLVSDSTIGEFRFSYDIAGRLALSVGPFGAVLYGRDHLGRVTSRQVVGQTPVAYAYDAAGNVTAATMLNASVARAFNSRGQLQAMSRSNGVVTNYSYDAAGRLLSIMHSGSSGVLGSHAYGYDAAGFVTRGETAMGQQLATQPQSARYDANNKQTQRAGAATVLTTFDANGNIVSESSPLNTVIYSWDSRNRLRKIDTSVGSTTLSYDPMGNLLRQVDAAAASQNRMTTFVLDDATNVALLVAEDSSGTSGISILAGRRVDEHWATNSSPGAVEFGLSDSVHSTTATVDGAGLVTSHYFYDPFGGGALSGSYPFSFNGRTVVRAALLYYRARYYSTAAGRFISEDPSDLHPSYAIARNNPISYVDPYGLYPELPDRWQGALQLISGTAQMVTAVAVAAAGGPTLGAVAAAVVTANFVLGGLQAGFGLAQVIGGNQVPGSVFKGVLGEPMGAVVDLLTGWGSRGLAALATWHDIYEALARYGPDAWNSLQKLLNQGASCGCNCCCAP